MAHAHTLSMNTARISLRDEHIELQAEIDPRVFASRLDPQTSDFGKLDAAALQAWVTRANEILAKQTTLRVDGQPVDAELRLGIDSKLLDEQSRASAAPAHEHLVPIRWEVREPFVAAKRIEVVFPAALGPVLVTFVQPATHWTAPGTTAGFSVLQSADEAPNQGPVRNRWGELAAVLAFVAILLNVGIALRKRKNEIPTSNSSAVTAL